MIAPPHPNRNHLRLYSTVPPSHWCCCSCVDQRSGLRYHLLGWREYRPRHCFLVVPRQIGSRRLDRFERLRCYGLEVCKLLLPSNTELEGRLRALPATQASRSSMCTCSGAVRYLYSTAWCPWICSRPLRMMSAARLRAKSCILRSVHTPEGRRGVTSTEQPSSSCFFPAE